MSVFEFVSTPLRQWRLRAESRLSKGLLNTVPLPLLEAAFGINKPLIKDHRVMDRYIRLACEANAFRPPLWQMSIAEARKHYEQLVPLLDYQFPDSVIKRDQLISLDSETAGSRSLWVRVYQKNTRNWQPARAGSEGESKPPLMVFFHGGGWVIGSLDSTDRFCGFLCEQLGHIIVSVGYRLTPENPFPLPQYDAIEAFAWVQQHAVDLGGDPERVYVTGDSAGGQLAAVVAQQTRLLQRPSPCLQVLIYPSLDRRQPGDSHHSLGQGYLLTRPMLDWFFDIFLPNETDFDNLLASPLLAEDDLIRQMPPTIIVTAGFDLLRDEGRLYANRLRGQGVLAAYQEHTSLVHGFITMTGGIPAAKRAVLQIVEQISSSIAKL